jgi:hypothetical protein
MPNVSFFYLWRDAPFELEMNCAKRQAVRRASEASNVRPNARFPQSSIYI